jgi:hypothetical protein
VILGLGSRSWSDEHDVEQYGTGPDTKGEAIHDDEIRGAPTRLRSRFSLFFFWESGIVGEARGNLKF